MGVGEEALGDSVMGSPLWPQPGNPGEKKTARYEVVLQCLTRCGVGHNAWAMVSDIDDRVNGDEPPEDEQFDSEDGGRSWKSRVVPELVQRLFVAGMGAVFTSEEGIRKLAKDVSLPKDVTKYLVSQAQTTREQLFRIVARELRSFLESINLGAELTKILTSLTFEIKMQVRLLPSDKPGTIRPDIEADVTVHRNGEEEPFD